MASNLERQSSMEEDRTSVVSSEAVTETKNAEAENVDAGNITANTNVLQLHRNLLELTTDNMALKLELDQCKEKIAHMRLELNAKNAEVKHQKARIRLLEFRLDCLRFDGGDKNAAVVPPANPDRSYNSNPDLAIPQAQGIGPHQLNDEPEEDQANGGEEQLSEEDNNLGARGFADDRRGERSMAVNGSHQAQRSDEDYEYCFVASSMSSGRHSRFQLTQSAENLLCSPRSSSFGNRHLSLTDSDLRQSGIDAYMSFRNDSEMSSLSPLTTSSSSSSSSSSLSSLSSSPLTSPSTMTSVTSLPSSNSEDQQPTLSSYLGQLQLSPLSSPSFQAAASLRRFHSTSLIHESENCAFIHRRKRRRTTAAPDDNDSDQETDNSDGNGKTMADSL